MVLRSACHHSGDNGRQSHSVIGKDVSASTTSSSPDCHYTPFSILPFFFFSSILLHYLKNDLQRNKYTFSMKNVLLFWWRAEHYYDLKKATTYFLKEKKIKIKGQQISIISFMKKEAQCLFNQSVPV